MKIQSEVVNNIMVLQKTIGTDKHKRDFMLSFGVGEDDDIIELFLTTKQAKKLCDKIIKLNLSSDAN